MPAPYRRIIPGDWVKLERIINELFSQILDADVSLSVLVSDITSNDSDITIIESNIVWMESDIDTNTSDIVVLKSDVATNASDIAAITGVPGGNDTEVQFNDGGSFGANANFTFDKNTDVMDVTGTITTTRLLAGGVKPG